MADYSLVSAKQLSSKLLLIVVLEVCLVFVLGILASKVAALTTLTPAFIFVFAFVCIGALSYISYLKLADTRGQAVKQPQEFSRGFGGWLLKRFQAKTYSGPDNLGSTALKAFIISTVGSVITIIGLARFAPDGSLLLVALGFVITGFIASIPVFTAPTNTRYDNVSDVVEEIIGVLAFTTLFFPIPGMLLAIMVWYFFFQ